MRRALSTSSILLVVVLAVLGIVAGASAFFASSGTGTATGQTGSLSAPTITSDTPGAGTVALSWSTVTPPVGSGGVTYYVSRNGGTPAGNCPTSTSPSGATSCTDSGLTKGQYTYTVTAVWNSWTATSAPAQVSVSFGAVSQLVFTTQPDGSPTGGVAFPQQPVVTAEDAGGNTVTSYTGTVALSIASGTPTSGGPGMLSGCTGTPTNGVTSFAGCMINTAGTGYKLNASDGTFATTSNAFNVAVGPATQLVFTTQPDGSPTGGRAFPQQPVVTAEDAGGNTVTSYAGTVGLSITPSTPASGGPGALSGCTGTLTNGVISFTGCKINTAGTGYKLNASDGTLPIATSNAFNVSIGPADQLLFTQQPDGSPTGGVAFPQQPEVTVEDAGGNIVTTDATTVVLSITSGTPTSGGPGTIAGCTGTETGGVTTFSGCKINTAGSGYKLHATDGSLTQADSAAFNVSVGPATQLVFTTEPDGSPTGGVAFPQQPIVTAEDAGGNTVTSYSGTVALSIASGTPTSGGPGALSGCTGTLTGGVTSFVGCKINTAGTGYRLTATDGTFTTTSSAFNVTVGPATQLLFTTQPDGSPVAKNPFPQQPVVSAEDAGGNTVTTYATSITLTIKSGTGTGGATLSGCTPSLVSGVDNFSGCKINEGGTGYQLNATDGTLTTTSNAFNVANLTATSVAEATGPSASLSTASITPVSGSTYLIFVYCSGQNSSCNSSSSDATVSSPAFSPNSATMATTKAVGTGSSKDCLEVFVATGGTTSGAVTVTAASGQTISFVNVVQLSPGAAVQNAGSIPTASGATSPATAALTSPNSLYGELVPVAVSDGNGAITMSTPAGWSVLGNAQSGASNAAMSVFFDPTAQSGFSSTLSPTTPTNGWATYSIEAG